MYIFSISIFVLFVSRKQKETTKEVTLRVTKGDDSKGGGNLDVSRSLGRFWRVLHSEPRDLGSQTPAGW